MIFHLKAFKGILWEIYECAHKSCLGVNFMAPWDQKVTKKGNFFDNFYFFGFLSPSLLSEISQSVEIVVGNIDSSNCTPYFLPDTPTSTTHRIKDEWLTCGGNLTPSFSVH